MGKDMLGMISFTRRSRVERFTGVVPQQNGHWGAQIYSNHQRIWLGTFKSENEAAMAYDSAAIKLRTGDSHRNFPWTSVTVQEPKFQTHLTTDAVLNMIRDGSYPSKFADFLRSQLGEIDVGQNISSLHGDGEFFSTLLFQKELTPSDVGKLNRLVIPKRYAVKHFPNLPKTNELSNMEAERVDEVQLEFYDRQMSLWKFRYCYWKSSQSFVFTRGWNRFVKEKGLREQDVIAFYLYESRDGRRLAQSFLVIDVAKKDDITENNNNNNNNENNDNNDNNKNKIEVGLGENLDPGGGVAKKGFRLFGVQID